VATGVPFQLTTEPAAKLAPEMVSERGTDAATAVPGVMDDSEGARIEKVNGPEVPVPLETVRNAVPGFWSRVEPTCAVSVVEFTNAVGMAVAFHDTTDCWTKFVPVTVIWTEEVPVGALVGVTDVWVGPASANCSRFERTPPACSTSMLIVSGLAVRVAGTAPVSWVALTKVVVSGMPCHRIRSPVTKLLPVRVRVKAPEPAVTVVGRMLAAAGPVPTVKGEGVELAPPGFCTVTLIAPAVAKSVAGTVAMSCDALTKVVVSAVVPHITVAPVMKFWPPTLSESVEAPTVAELGDRARMVGPPMVKATAFEVPPAVTTVTLTVPAVARRLLVRFTVSEVALFTSVGRGVLPHMTVVPVAV